MNLLIATTNPSKIDEIRAILAGLPIELQTLASYPGIPEPEETGLAFADNARQKALHYAAAAHELTVSEDSGLEIDGLDGAPGVHSARFNGVTYAEKFQRIYDQLRQRGVAASSARFVCALALADRGQIIYETRQTVEGTLAASPRGRGGFGYDPIFFYPPYGRTLAEVSPDEKAAVSHRGQAFRALREFLSEWER